MRDSAGVDPLHSQLHFLFIYYHLFKLLIRPGLLNHRSSTKLDVIALKFKIQRAVSLNFIQNLTQELQTHICTSR